MIQDIAEVEDYLGRAYLKVAGVTLAREGDVCRDTELPEAKNVYIWTRSLLLVAAERINDVCNEPLVSR